MINNQIILFKFIEINDNVNWNHISIDYKLSVNFIRDLGSTMKEAVHRS